MGKTVKIVPMNLLPSYSGLTNELQEVQVEDNWDFNVMGSCVGKEYEDGEKVSFLVRDKENGNTELLDRLIKDYVLEEKSVTVFKEDELMGCALYFILYNVVDHYTAKPTVTDKFVESAMNVNYEVTYELLFVAGEGYKKYMTVTYKTGGSGAVSFYDQLEDLKDYFEELSEEEGTEFSMEDGYMNVDFYDTVGSKETLEINSVEEFMSMLASARVIDIKEEIV